VVPRDRELRPQGTVAGGGGSGRAHFARLPIQRSNANGSRSMSLTTLHRPPPASTR
jgi:hypothetical protein